MNRLLFTIAFLILLGATLASGWVHGELINRWGEADALELAAGRLGRELPPRLGPWRLVKTIELEEDAAKILRVAGHLHGMYANEQTGDSVVIAVLAGPSGPLAVHTPEICYPAAEYELAGLRHQWKVADASGQNHALWEIHANSRHSTRPNLRVLYGWSRGGPWEAVVGPRFALAGLPVLYKLQLAGPVRQSQSAQERDPCEDFLSRFLEELQPRLVTPSRGSSLVTRSTRKGPLP
jgi:hypothetical protein